MNLKNFTIMAKKIIEILENYNNTTNYQNLVSYLTTGRTSPTPELEQSIKDTINSINSTNLQQQEALDLIPHSESIINNLDISNVIGLGAKERLNSIISNELFNAPSIITKLISDLDTAKTQLKNIVGEMEKFGFKFETYESALLSIEYLGSYEVDNTAELKSRLDDIESIIRAYARLTNNPEAFTKPKIISISKSSPLTIDIGDGIAIYSTLVLVAKGITWAMSRVEQAIKIRIECEELKQKKITSKVMNNEFKELEKAETSDSNIKIFIDDLYKNSQANAKNGAENETKKDLLEATKLLVKMIEGGASVRVYPPETVEAESESEVAEIKALNLSMSMGYKTINKGQDHLKLLGEESKNTSKDKSKKTSDNKGDDSQSVKA